MIVKLLKPENPRLLQSGLDLFYLLLKNKIQISTSCLKNVETLAIFIIKREVLNDLTRISLKVA